MAPTRRFTRRCAASKISRSRRPATSCSRTRRRRSSGPISTPDRAKTRVLTPSPAIAGTFLIRVDGKHVFNPANGGIVAMLLMTTQVWVSPGQWGAVASFAFLMACTGSLVVNRAARSDVTYAFIAFYCTLVFGRSVSLGEPLTIPLHRLESGALLLFTFFMISDPKTTPDSRTGRVLFAALVAFGGWYINYRLFRTNGILWSLAVGAILVPIINALLPAKTYALRRRTAAA